MPPPKANTAHTNASRSAKEPNTSTATPPLPRSPESYILLSWLLGASRGTLGVSPGSRFILGRAFCLDVLGLEFPIGPEVAFHKSLSLVRKGIRQRVGSRVAYGNRFPLAFQNKINPPRRVVNAAHRNGSAHANALRPLRAVQVLQFGNGVIVRLALAVPKPGEEPQRRHDNADPDSEFGLFL